MQDEGRASISSEFGALLRHHRLAAGLSQGALAERARMSSYGISALERGFRRTPHHETLALLAGALALGAEERKAFETAARAAQVRRLGGGSVTVGPWPRAGNSNLPRALTNFVGREKELEEIAALVRGNRLVSLTGAGGIGKTQAAVQVGIALNGAEDLTVCFVSLASVADPSLVAETIAAALGVQPVPHRPPAETLLTYLKNKTLLLILDSCEQVVAQAAALSEALVSGCPRLRILATSRERLKIPGERAYRLPSLNVPSPEAAPRLTAAAASAYGAILLFDDRARAVNHRFALTDENAPIVADICRRLDGIPLAIELAAARVNLLSVKALSERLDECFRALRSSERAAVPRHQTMRAAIDWSYELLSPQEQRLFEHLSIFVGGCTLAVAARVCGDGDGAEDVVLDLLSSLVDKSLVVPDLEGLEPRYRLLEPFLHYARERLALRGEEKILARRHAHAFLELAGMLDHAYDSDAGELWRDLARGELDNWRTALQWALMERGDVDLGQRLVFSLNPLWQNFATVEGRRWLDAALQLVDERTSTSVLAGLSYAESTIAWALLQHHMQLSSSEAAMAHYRTTGDARGVARSQIRAAHALMCLGRLAEAEPLLQEALEAARRLSKQILAAYALRCFGDLRAMQGDIAAAREFIAEGIRSYEAVGSKLGVAVATTDLCAIEFLVGNVEPALRYAIDAATALRPFNDARLLVIALHGAARCLIALDRYDEAEQHAREALELSCEHDLETFAANSLQQLAAIEVLRPYAASEDRDQTYKKSASILGFVNARLVARGVPRMTRLAPEYDRAVTVLRDAMGADRVESTMATGAAMTQEEAVAALTTSRG